MIKIDFNEMLPKSPNADEMIFSCPCNQQFRRNETITLLNFNRFSYFLYVYMDGVFQGPIQDHCVIKSFMPRCQKWKMSKNDVSNMCYVINLSAVTFKPDEPIIFSSPLI